jgi:hypothetical protein
VELPRELPFRVTETGAQWADTTREDAGVLTLEVPPTPALELDEPESPKDFPSVPSLWVATTPDWRPTLNREVDDWSARIYVQRYG